MGRVFYSPLRYLDAVDFMGKTCEKKDSFVYLGPPYFDAGPKLYSENYDKFGHQNLKEFIANSNIKWALSCDLNQYMVELYSDNEAVSYHQYQST